MNLPIIHIQLQGMQQELSVMFTKELLRLDEDVQNAIKEACSPENVKRIINQSVAGYLQESIDREIKAFFTYGKGQDFIKNEVKNKLEEQLCKEI